MILPLPALTLLALLAAPAPPEAGTPVSFDEAIGFAAETPAVAGARSAAEEQRRVGEKLSSMSGNPSLLLQPGAARDPIDGSWNYIAEGTVVQGWNLSGLAGDRKEAVRLEGDQLASEARAAALSHRLAAAQAWTELWAAQQALADAERELEGAADFSRRMARAVEVAAFTRAEGADAATYAAEARVAALAAEGEAADRGYQLAVALGRPEARPLVARGPLPAPPVPPRAQWPALLDSAARLPAVQAQRLAADAARARDAEARSTRGWALDTGVKGSRDFLGTWGVQAVLGLTFPVFDRGERDASREAASAVRTAGEHREAAAVAVTELARALHEVEHSGEVLEAMEKELVPAAEENARARAVSLQAGDTTVQEVLVVKRVAAAARQRLGKARAAHAWARVKVWMLLADVSGGTIR